MHHPAQERVLNRWLETTENITDQIDFIYFDINIEESEPDDYMFEQFQCEGVEV